MISSNPPGSPAIPRNLQQVSSNSRISIDLHCANLSSITRNLNPRLPNPHPIFVRRAFTTDREDSGKFLEKVPKDLQRIRKNEWKEGKKEGKGGGGERRRYG
eukprot:1365026-Amorphochlora_amoeboformis.AAC.1